MEERGGVNCLLFVNFVLFGESEKRLIGLIEWFGSKYRGSVRGCKWLRKVGSVHGR